MIFRLLLDPDCEESVTAQVHARTPLISEIERLIAQDSLADQIPGYIGDEITMLEIAGVECFAAENDRTYAVYQDGTRYLIRKRLCELEKRLPGHFERISKSAIANWKQIERFKVQLSGAVDAVFKCGYEECISRRCFADLKRRYGL